MPIQPSMARLVQMGPDGDSSIEPNPPTSSADAVVKNRDAPEDIDQATLLFRQGNYEKAAELYTGILEAKSAEGIDPLDVSLAPIYLHYGKCLLFLGQQEIFTKATESASSALGQAVEEATFAGASKASTGSKLIQLDGSEEQEIPEENEADTIVEDIDESPIDGTVADEFTVSRSAAGKRVLDESATSEAAIEDEQSEDDEKEAGSCTEIASDDLQLAWEALDTARLIYLQQPIAEVCQQLVDVYSALGDVSMESGAFQQAQQDYEESLKFLEDVQPPSNASLRCHAEVFYKIALSLEYEGKFAEAEGSLRAALNLLRTVRDSGRDEKEREEIAQIIPDIETKLEDLQSCQQQQSGISDLGIGPSGSGKGSRGADVSSAVDISAMVKRKQPMSEGNLEKREKKEDASPE